jgi:hypothetical protein
MFHFQIQLDLKFLETASKPQLGTHAQVSFCFASLHGLRRLHPLITGTFSVACSVAVLRQTAAAL